MRYNNSQTFHAIILISLFACPVIAGQPEFLAKRDAGHVRLMCYNVNWDAIFLDDDTLNHKFRRHSLQGEFVRVVRAVSPDIICLQEINPARPARHIGDILDRGLPVDPDDDSRLWQAGIGQDNVIAARWPLTMIASDTSPPTGRGHAMALVDLPNEQYAADLYIINAHFKSAGGAANIARRTNHADAIMCWLRDAREPGGRIDLPQRTPIVICGDLNVYDNDPHRHLFTLTSGDILDETTFGPDFLPDWDNTTLADVLPVHNARGCQRWTWRDDTTKFNPGALDRVIYTDSVLEVAHAFVLNTATLTDAELAFTGLDKRDVALDFAKGEFDHLPIIVDFAFPHAAEPPSVPEPQPSSEPQPSPAPHP